MERDDSGHPVNVIELQRFGAPDERLARIAQNIGFEAWRAQLPRRTDAEIRRVFDPDNPEPKAERLMERMSDKARTGRFAGIIALHGGVEIGYAWATDDMSGNRLGRFIKKAKGKKPYAWVAQINVLPKLQGEGIGSAMLGEVLREFDSDQMPTAYVFDENQRSLRWFKKKGFSPSPDAPVPKTVYFGTESEPAMQWRLVANSSHDVVMRSYEQAILRGVVPIEEPS